MKHCREELIGVAVHPLCVVVATLKRSPPEAQCDCLQGGGRGAWLWAQMRSVGAAPMAISAQHVRRNASVRTGLCVYMDRSSQTALLLGGQPLHACLMH
mmetsp:Transcript_78009/g.228689  ORF Transcript_78009/g.228689 Transcript_78009/m.228689 type:complete len:99 (+) Transcript_78009:1390-1686(+)